MYDSHSRLHIHYDTIVLHYYYEEAYAELLSKDKASYVDNCLSTDVIKNCINKLTLGKAAGCDSTDVEHLKYAHCNAINLTVIFKNILNFATIPDAFTYEVINPIIKDKTINCDNISKYRAISLSLYHLI